MAITFAGLPIIKGGISTGGLDPNWREDGETTQIYVLDTKAYTNIFTYFPGLSYGTTAVSSNGNSTSTTSVVSTITPVNNTYIRDNFNFVVRFSDYEYDASNIFYGMSKMNSEVVFGNNINNLYRTFQSCGRFNAPVTIQSNVVNMTQTFQSCGAFNQPVNIPSTVTDMYQTFIGCDKFNQPVNIPSTVNNYSKIFQSCTSFNQNVNLPNTMGDLSALFYSCQSLDQNIKIPESAINLYQMFYLCYNLNKNIKIPENANNVTYMFYECRNLNQNIQIPIRNTNNFVYMFYNCQKMTPSLETLPIGSNYNYVGMFSNSNIYLSTTSEHYRILMLLNSIMSGGYGNSNLIGVFNGAVWENVWNVRLNSTEYGYMAGNGAYINCKGNGNGDIYITDRQDCYLKGIDNTTIHIAFSNAGQVRTGFVFYGNNIFVKNNVRLLSEGQCNYTQCTLRNAILYNNANLYVSTSNHITSLASNTTMGNNTNLTLSGSSGYASSDWTIENAISTLFVNDRSNINVTIYTGGMNCTNFGNGVSGLTLTNSNMNFYWEGTFNSQRYTSGLGCRSIFTQGTIIDSNVNVSSSVLSQGIYSLLNTVSLSGNINFHINSTLVYGSTTTGIQYPIMNCIFLNDTNLNIRMNSNSNVQEQRILYGTSVQDKNLNLIYNRYRYLSTPSYVTSIIEQGNFKNALVNINLYNTNNVGVMISYANINNSYIRVYSTTSSRYITSQVMSYVNINDGFTLDTNYVLNCQTLFSYCNIVNTNLGNSNFSTNVKNPTLDCFLFNHTKIVNSNINGFYNMSRLGYNTSVKYSNIDITTNNIYTSTWYGQLFTFMHSSLSITTNRESGFMQGSIFLNSNLDYTVKDSTGYTHSSYFLQNTRFVNSNINYTVTNSDVTDPTSWTRRTYFYKIGLVGSKLNMYINLNNLYYLGHSTQPLFNDSYETEMGNSIYDSDISITAINANNLLNMFFKMSFYSNTNITLNMPQLGYQQYIFHQTNFTNSNTNITLNMPNLSNCNNLFRLCNFNNSNANINLITPSTYMINMFWNYCATNHTNFNLTLPNATDVTELMSFGSVSTSYHSNSIIRLNAPNLLNAYRVYNGMESYIQSYNITTYINFPKLNHENIYFFSDNTKLTFTQQSNGLWYNSKYHIYCAN